MNEKEEVVLGTQIDYMRETADKIKNETDGSVNLIWCLLDNNGNREFRNFKLSDVNELTTELQSAERALRLRKKEIGLERASDDHNYDGDW